MSDTVIIFLVIAGIIIFFAIILFNSLIGKRNAVDNAFACVDVQLKKRCDLLPNLVATVKQYMTHEASVFTAVAELRSKANNPALSQGERMAAQAEIGRYVRNIMIQAENYPQLKASDNFMQLQRTLNEIEEQLSAARRAFNAAVTDFNNAIQMFPANIFAAVFGFSKRELFVIDESERKVPNVKDLFS